MHKASLHVLKLAKICSETTYIRKVSPLHFRLDITRTSKVSPLHFRLDITRTSKVRPMHLGLGPTRMRRAGITELVRLHRQYSLLTIAPIEQLVGFLATVHLVKACLDAVGTQVGLPGLMIHVPLSLVCLSVTVYLHTHQVTTLTLQ
jgi:hypothetical protein